MLYLVYMPGFRINLHVTMNMVYMKTRGVRIYAIHCGMKCTVTVARLSLGGIPG